MAVIGFAKEMPEGRSALFDEVSGRRQYRRRFLVQTNSKYDDALIVRAAPGLPGRGMPYITDSSNDPFARVVSVSPVQSPKLWTLWYVDVEYDTVAPPDTNPLDDPPEIEVDFETRQKAYPGRFVQEQSQPNGEPGGRVFKALCNSAGEPYDPPQTYPSSVSVVTITRNELFYSQLLATQYKDSLNSDPFAQHQPRQVMMRGIRARRVYVSGQNNGDPSLAFWQVTYVLVFDREGHDLHLPDVGHYYYELNEADERISDPIAFGTADGQPMLGYLNGKGGRLSNTATEPVYNVFDDTLKLMPFSVLNLPQDFNVNVAARRGQRRSAGG